MSDADEGYEIPTPPREDLLEEPEAGNPHEPEEFDPDSLGPDIPTPPGPGEDFDEKAVELFWKLVVVFNVGLFAASIGVLQIVFEVRPELGVQVFLLGVLALAYGTFRYYRFRTSDEE